MRASESKYYKCLYFMSNALARKMEKLAQESWAKVDLSPSHAYLLMVVLEEPGIQPSCIAGQLQLQPSTVTRLIEKLEEKKLLIRTSAGKTTNVYPTPRAKELLPRLRECVNEFNSSCAIILGKDESNKLIQSMGKIADRISV